MQGAYSSSAPVNACCAFATLVQTLTPEVFLQVLMSINQFKMMGAKTLLDPTMVLSMLSKFSGVVVQNGPNTTSTMFYKETTKLLSLWPAFWGVKSSTGLFTSQYADVVGQFIPTGGAIADSYASLQALSNAYASTSNPADAMFGIVSALGNIVSEGDFTSASNAEVSVSTFVGLMSSYTSLLSMVSS